MFSCHNGMELNISNRKDSGNLQIAEMITFPNKQWVKNRKNIEYCDLNIVIIVRM